MNKRAFRNGRATVRETYAATVFRGCKCGIGNCTDPVTVRASVFWPLDELMKRDAAFAVMARVNPKGIHDNLVTFRNNDGTPAQYIRHRTVYACTKHDTDLQRACAGKDIPSWVVVEFQRGPAEAPIMTGWSAELVNANSVHHTPAPHSEEHGSFRVTDRRSSAHLIGRAPDPARKTG